MLTYFDNNFNKDDNSAIFNVNLYLIVSYSIKMPFILSDSVILHSVKFNSVTVILNFVTFNFDALNFVSLYSKHIHFKQYIYCYRNLKSISHHNLILTQNFN